MMVEGLVPPLPDLKEKKVLITGGLGFIGSNLAQACLELGAAVTIYDCLDPRSGGSLYNVQDISQDIELVFSDILNFDEVSRHIVGKEYIFNCSASTSHPFSMREPLIDLDVNGRGVINLLEAARRFNREVKFIQLGTTTQIGKLQYCPADEKHPEFPTDIYSANKSVSEKYVLIYGNAYGIPVTVIRLPNVFGPKATIHSSDFTFNNFFIGLALQGKDISVFGKGGQIRNVLFVDDAVSAIINAAISEKSLGEVFFAVGDHHYSVAEIAAATVNNIGSGGVRFIDWPKGKEDTDVGDAVISNAKIKNVLGWRPEIGLGEGLRKTGDYFRPRLSHYLR